MAAETKPVAEAGPEAVEAVFSGLGEVSDEAWCYSNRCCVEQVLCCVARDVRVEPQPLVVCSLEGVERDLVHLG